MILVSQDPGWHLGPLLTGAGAPHKPPKLIETDGGLVLIGAALPQDLARREIEAEDLHFFDNEDPGNPDDVRRAAGRAEFLERRRE